MIKTKITGRQLFSLTAGGSLGGSVLIIAALMASIAKQDAWIGSIVTVITGLPVIWVYVFLGSRFPNMNYIEIIRTVLGKWLGSVVAASTMLFYIQGSSHVPWHVGDFITSQVMPETPAYVVNALFITAIAVAALYGLEAFARATEIFLIISTIMFIFAMVLVLPNAKIENLQPVLENGFLPVLKSSVFLSCFITYPLITIMMIYPVGIDNLREAKKSIFTGYFWAGSISFLAILMSILVLGWPITANTRYPAFRLAKEIDVGIIFSRIEFIVFVSWILTQFIINTLFFYAGITGLSQLLKLKNHKILVIPAAFLALIFSGIVFPDVIYQENWIAFGWVPYIITHSFIFPVLILVVYLVKRVIEKHSVNNGKKSKENRNTDIV